LRNHVDTQLVKHFQCYFLFSRLLLLVNKVVNFYFYHYFLLKVVQHLTLIEANILSFLLANEKKLPSEGSAYLLTMFQCTESCLQ